MVKESTVVSCLVDGYPLVTALVVGAVVFVVVIILVVVVLRRRRSRSSRFRTSNVIFV